MSSGSSTRGTNFAIIALQLRARDDLPAPVPKGSPTRGQVQVIGSLTTPLSSVLLLLMCTAPTRVSFADLLLLHFNLMKDVFTCLIN